MFDRAATFCFKDDPHQPDVMKCLHYYTYSSAKIICRLRSHLNLLKSSPGDRDTLASFSEGLESLAQESEIWGFENISRLGRRLKQVLIDLETGDQTLDTRVFQLFGEGLNMLAALVSNCEKEYQQKNSVVKLLDSLAHTGNRI